MIKYLILIILILRPMATYYSPKAIENRLREGYTEYGVPISPMFGYKTSSAGTQERAYFIWKQYGNIFDAEKCWQLAEDEERLISHFRWFMVLEKLKREA